MPTEQVKKLADEYGVSVHKVERQWNRCKDRVNRGNKSDDEYYGAVYECTKNAVKAMKEANKEQS